MNNYPPGVTGNESQITGEFSPEEINAEIESVQSTLRDEVEQIICFLDDHGHGNASASWDGRIEKALELLNDELGDCLIQTEPDYD